MVTTATLLESCDGPDSGLGLQVFECLHGCFQSACGLFGLIDHNFKMLTGVLLLLIITLIMILIGQSFGPGQICEPLCRLCESAPSFCVSVCSLCAHSAHLCCDFSLVSLVSIASLSSIGRLLVINDFERSAVRLRSLIIAVLLL